MKEKTKRFLVDVNPDLHKSTKRAAIDAGMSLSKYILGAITMRLGRDSKKEQ